MLGKSSNQLGLFAAVRLYLHDVGRDEDLADLYWKAR